MPKNLLKSNFLLKDGIRQSVKALYLQDSITLSDNLELLAGVRYDEYSDFGSAISPRISAIYKYSDRVSFKGMYSKAFRAPSWVELYATIPNLSLGNENLKAETIDSFELAYIYKENSTNYFKTNIYYSKIDNSIYRDLQSRIYNNKGIHYLYGIESEYKRVINYLNQFYINYSYTQAVDENREELPCIARHMLKAYHIYNPFSKFTISSIIKYIGTREREESDSRDKLKGYITLDANFIYEFENSLNLSVNLKNILDADVKYPATMNSYTDDLQREGRGLFISLSKEF